MVRPGQWKPVRDSTGLVEKSGLLFGPGEFHDCVREVFSAVTNEEQARLMRLLPSKLPDSDFLVAVASQVLVAAEIKSPVHGASVRVLLSFTSKAVAPHLASVLQARLRSFIVDENAAVLAELTVMFENFPPGVAAVDRCLSQVLHFINTALRHAVATLSSPSAVRTVHAACRLIVLVLQKCSLRCSDEGLVEGPTNPVDPAYQEILTVLLADIARLMVLPLPMETGANAALATLLLVALLQGKDAALALTVVNDDPGNFEGVDLREDKCRLHLATATLPQRWAWSHRHRLVKQLLDLAESNAGDGAVQLSVARAIHQHLRCPDYDTDSEPSRRDRVARFVLGWLQHPGDSVRHAGRDCLGVLLAALTSVQLTGLLASVAALPLRPRLVAVETVARRMGGEVLLVAMPTLPEDLLKAMADPQLGKKAEAAYERLLRDSHSWTKPADWLTQWVEPALTANHGVGRMTALSVAAELEPAWFARTATDAHTDVQVGLCCAQIGDRLKLGSTHSDETDQSKEPTTWRGLVTTATMEAALGHRDHQTRLQALWLLAGSRFATDPPTAQDLRLLRAGIQRSACSDDEAARLEALAVVKRCLRRIKISAMALARDQRKDTAAAHASFLRWLTQWCQRSLFSGANFARRSFALATLEQLSPVDVAALVSPGVLVAALRDPFESNRNAARMLLEQYSLEQLGLESAESMLQLVQRSLSLAESSRPPDSPVAAHLLRLLTSFDQSRAALLAAGSSVRDDEVPCSRLLLAHLLVVRLRAQITVAKRSLLLAASTAPMHGTACCIRALLTDVPLEKLGGNAAWGRIVGQLVSCCEDMLDAAGPLCSSCSPEGLLPPEDIQLSDFGNSKDDVEVPTATAQMALICAWRSVKEAALLLGNLAERLPVATAVGTDGLLTEERLNQIGERLLQLLQETRHRGAFEQAQVAVTAVARRLWLRGSPMPAQWLNDVVTEVASGNDLCETRRGAGLPLLVTALVGSQRHHQEAIPVVTRLLEIAGQAGSAQAANRVAALNVLRAAFRDSQLGVTLTPLLSAAMETAMAATAVSAWPERSAGTLLFAALATRLLGVESTAGQRSSAPALFQRHPALAPCLATALGGSEPARLPALTLLARLSPALADDGVQLRDLATLVESCAGCQGLHLRKLAALALSALVPQDRRPDALARILRRLETAASANERHGNLLMLHRLLSPSPPSEVWGWTADSLCRVVPALVADGNGPVLTEWARCVAQLGAAGTIDRERLGLLREALQRCSDANVRYDICAELLQDSVVLATLAIATALASVDNLAAKNLPTKALANLSLAPAPLETDSFVSTPLANTSLANTALGPVPLTACYLPTESLPVLSARLLLSPATRTAALAFLKSAPTTLLDCVEIREAVHKLQDSGADEAQVLELCCHWPAFLRPSDWHRALRLADSDSEPDRCAAIGCLAFLPPPKEGWEQLVEALENGAEEERSTACHLQVAKAVSRLVTVPEVGTLPAVTWLRLHTLLVRLLQHCEASVRDAATPSWPRTPELCRDLPREPHGTLEAVLSTLSTHEYAPIGMVAWSWQGLMDDVELSLQASPFDRGESNGFEEAGLIAELCCNLLRTLETATWTNQVPDEVMSWLGKHVGVSTLGPRRSLGDYVVAILKETNELQGCDSRILDWSRFFAPDFAPASAAAYRRQLVGNAVNHQPVAE